MDNPESLTELLRNAKTVDAALMAQAKQISQGKPLHLFQIGKLTRLILLASRCQVYFYAVFGLGYMAVVGTQKYEQYSREITALDDKGKYYETKKGQLESKLVKIKASAALFGLTSALGIYVTLKMGRRIPKSIYLHDQTLLVQFYSPLFRTRVQAGAVENLKHYDKKHLLDKTVEFTFKGEKLATLGTGESHRNVMKYLASN